MKRKISEITKDSTFNLETTEILGIHQKDARNLNELIPNEFVDLVITSPPYPMVKMWDEIFYSLNEKIGKQESWQVKNKMEIFEKMHDELDTVWKRLFYCVKMGGIVVINIGDATRSIQKQFTLFPNAARITMAMIKLGFTPLPNIYWKKPTNGPNAFLGSGFYPVNAYVTLDCEHILIFRKGNLRQFPCKDPVREKSKFSKEERNKWFTQTWEGITGTSQKKVNGRRTAAFPEEIPSRLIKMFSIIGDIVFDPFVGTGTTGKVAKQLGRRFIGLDIDEEYVKEAKKVIQESKINISLCSEKKQKVK